MEYLAVMYHYVRRPNWKGIVPLAPMAVEIVFPNRYSKAIIKAN
jgi:hypothetical protein